MSIEDYEIQKDKEFIQLSKLILADQDKDISKEDLINWNIKYRNLDRLRIRETSDPDFENYFQMAHKSSIDPFINWQATEDEYDDEYYKEMRERLEFFQGGAKWLEHIARYYHLSPPFVRPNSNIPEKIIELYMETRWCYIYEQFNACITLSRALIESIAKAFFSLTRDENENYPLAKVINFIQKTENITPECRNTLKGVVYKANSVLHEGQLTSEEEALNAINATKLFIEEIFRKRRNFSN